MNTKPSIPMTPRAPQGPSDMELNAVPPDPYLPPYGGSSAQFADLVCGPYMNPDQTANVLISVGRKGTR